MTTLCVVDVWSTKPKDHGVCRDGGGKNKKYLYTGQLCSTVQALKYKCTYITSTAMGFCLLCKVMHVRAQSMDMRGKS